MRPKHFVRILAVLCCLSFVASAAQADELRMENPSKSGEKHLAAPIVETICTAPPRAGVIISAVSSNPACVSVTPAARMTGVSGCANFTVRCVNGTCGPVTITWSAPGYLPFTETYSCNTALPDTLVYTPPGGGHTVSYVPTLGEWALIALSLLLIGVAGAAFVARRRRTTI